ncbi:MAG: oligopeptide transporter permease OppB [Verrucomicrobiota bacterium]|jgi:oligopeptide transport system permease protein
MYFLRRFLFLIPLTWVIVTLSFFLVRVAPGGPFDRERRPASPAVERALATKYHLDESLGSQYLRFLGLRWERQPDGSWQRAPGGLIAGDLGLSLKYRNHSVTDIIRQGLPVSLALGGAAFLFALGFGIPLGVYTAVRRGHTGDWLGSLVALLFICIPGFVIGPLLILVFALQTGWFPVGLWGTPRHVVLPMIALGLYFGGRVARLTREGMSQALLSEFVRTARAKGVSELGVLLRHAFPIAVMPVVSYSGPMLADLLTGSFVVENIFQIPGIGVFLVNSSLGRDYTMVVGLVLLYAVLLLVLNLLVDFTYSLLDPRVRHE